MRRCVLQKPGPLVALSKSDRCWNRQCDGSRAIDRPDTRATHAALVSVFREEAGRLTSALVRILGDFDVAEEIVQDALLVALERWPVDGIPARPGAWLLTVARRLALNQLSRDARYQTKLAQLEQPVLSEPDDRLRLMFTCCHPALSHAAQIALT